MDNIVIGLTGSWGSGCTTAAEHLEKNHGFLKYSLSEAIKGVVKKLTNPRNTRRYLGASILEKETFRLERKARPTDVSNRIARLTALPILEQRELLQDIGNALREKRGNDYLIKELLGKAGGIKTRVKGGTNVVIDGIKNIAETELLSILFKDYFLININADYEERRSRKNIDEPLFWGIDNRDADEEQQNRKIFGQQVSKCIDLADIVILNTGNNVEFCNKLDSYLEKIKKGGSKIIPSFDECFMTAAYTVSKFSRCKHRKVGAVITKGDYIIACGYNEAPHGSKSCVARYGYCYRDDVKSYFKLSEPVEGTEFPSEKAKYELEKAVNRNLDLCRAIHAEERAILQVAARGGISLMDCNLYTTLFPCQLCAKKIIETGLSRVVYYEPYPTPEAIKLFQEAKRDSRENDPKVELVQFEGVKANGFFRVYRPSERS